MSINQEIREANKLRKESAAARSKMLFVTVSTGVMVMFFVAIFLNINSLNQSAAPAPVAMVAQEKEQQPSDNVKERVVEKHVRVKRGRKKERVKSRSVTVKSKNTIKKSAPAVIDQVKDSEEIKWMTYKTSGESKEYYLPDNSKISMSPNSEIKYASNFKEDRVLYFSGTAFFEITHKSNSQPFFIYSNVSKTEVIGTSFTIKSPKGALEDVINVVTGKVAFSAQNEPSRVIFLTAGKECTIKENEEGRIGYLTVDSREVAKNDKIVFNNTKLSEVISTLKDFYKVSITTSSADILNCKFSGTFVNADIDEVMRDISESFNLSLSQEEGEYVLSGKSCSK